MIEASLTFHSGGTFQSKIFFLDFIFFILNLEIIFLIRIKLFFIPSKSPSLIGKSFFLHNNNYFLRTNLINIV